MIYMLFATQTPPPGHVERIVFLHPGSQQDVMQFASQIIGVKPVVPYQIANLLNQPKPSQASIYCRQIKPLSGVQPGGAGGASNQPAGFGLKDIPSDLRAVRPGDRKEHTVMPSGLGDRYGSLPTELLGEFM